MGIGKTCLTSKDNKNDKVYTPSTVAKLMIEECQIQPKDKVLDCSKGGGVFYNNLPECEKYWCEIDEGQDFFNFNSNVDIIVGNPPYSLWNKWLKKSVELNPTKICYIFGILNLTPKRIAEMEQKGYYITKMIFCNVSWWFSYSIICVFQKLNTKPLTQVEIIRNSFVCDVCNSRCKRGQYGNNPNICTAIK